MEPVFHRDFSRSLSDWRKLRILLILPYAPNLDLMNSSEKMSRGSKRVGRDLTTKQQLGSTLPAEKHRVSRKDNEGPWGGTSTQKIQAKIWMRLHSPSLPNLRAATAEVEELPGTKCRVLETRSPDT